MKVQIKKLVPEAELPTYAHIDLETGNPNDMGMDIKCTSFEYDFKKDRFVYHTGLAFKIPSGYGMLIFPRSSNTKTELYLPNSVGILDSTYTGELLFIYKLRDNIESYLGYYDDKENVSLEAINELSPYGPGDRIGQIVIFPYPFIEFIEKDELPQTDRGADGGLIRKENNFK